MRKVGSESSCGDECVIHFLVMVENIFFYGLVIWVCMMRVCSNAITTFGGVINLHLFLFSLSFIHFRVPIPSFIVLNTLLVYKFSMESRQLGILSLFFKENFVYLKTKRKTHFN